MTRGKYIASGDQIVNRVTGEVIPDDEPVFILRARDRLAAGTICHYLRKAVEDRCIPSHLEGIVDSLICFVAFREKNSSKMKQPGITSGLVA